MQDGKIVSFALMFILFTFQTPHKIEKEENIELKETNNYVNLSDLKCVRSMNSEETLDCLHHD